jgi:lysophospholipase L1-like esterase
MRKFTAALIGYFIITISPGAIAQAFNSVDSTPSITYLNYRPMPPNAYRILFMGDSLTYHGQTPNLWDYDSGMAASSPNNDFVHLVSQHIQSKMGRRPVEILINNGGTGKIGSMLAYLTSHPDLKPSLIIFQGGENDPFDGSFKDTYRSLLNLYQSSKIPYIVMGDWWNDDKRDFDRQEALAHGYAWIDINVFNKNPEMRGDGGPYHVDGVAKHPNDKGMRAIADAIDGQFDKMIFPSIRKHN